MNEIVAALMPLLITAATVVLAMLTIALRRAHGLTVGVTFIGIALAFVSLVPSMTADVSATIAIGQLLVVDGIARVAMALILLTTLAILTLCPPYVGGYRGNREELYLLLGVGTVGGLTLACASHAATLLLGLELLGLPMVGAVAYGVDRARSIEGGVKYLVLSAAASATLLFGIALIYAEYGALDLSTLATAIARAGQGSTLATAGALMVLAGLAFKLSFVPFHQWTPDVYEAAPMPVTAYLATVVKLGAFVAALRVLHADAGGASPLIASAIVALALASMVVGSVLALRQTSLKRLLAYSSIANFGYLAVLLAIPGLLSVRAAGIYLVGYLVASLGVFGVMTVVSSPTQGHDREALDDYRGLFWQRPYMAAILIAMVLSLAGIPFTAGFIGKLAVMGVGVRAGEWWLVGGVALASALGIFYYLRIIGALLTEATPAWSAAPHGWLRAAGAAVLLAAAIVTVALGVLPESLFLIGRDLVSP